MKIAGVVRDEVKLELLEFMLEEDLPSLSQAVGAALGQWLTDRRRRRESQSGGDRDSPLQSPPGVLNPKKAAPEAGESVEGRNAESEDKPEKPVGHGDEVPDLSWVDHLGEIEGHLSPVEKAILKGLRDYRDDRVKPEQKPASPKEPQSESE